MESNPKKIEKSKRDLFGYESKICWEFCKLNSKLLLHWQFKKKKIMLCEVVPYGCTFSRMVVINKVFVWCKNLVQFGRSVLLLSVGCLLLICERCCSSLFERDDVQKTILWELPSVRLLLCFSFNFPCLVLFLPFFLLHWLFHEPLLARRPIYILCLCDYEFI